MEESHGLHFYWRRTHMEQWSLTGGSLRCLAMSEFLMLPHWSSVLPLSHSVAYDELAIAEPHPKVCAAGRGRGH
jgi:hypothetical protein